MSRAGSSRNWLIDERVSWNGMNVGVEIEYSITFANRGSCPVLHSSWHSNNQPTGN